MSKGMRSVCGGRVGVASEIKRTEPWTDLADIPILNPFIPRG